MSKSKALGNKQKKQPSSATLIQHQQLYQGPLPPAETLAKYNEVVPNAAERIITMAEQQAIHRQMLENKVIDSDIRNSRLGLIYGLIIGITSVICGTISIFFGHSVGGSIIGGVGLTGLVSVFVYGSTQKRKEREERLRIQTGQK